MYRYLFGLKRLALVTGLVTAVFTQVAAQKSQVAPDSVSGKKSYQGYVISLRTAQNNTVLFDLIQKGRPVFKQPLNPVTMQPEGFASVDEAERVARWMIDNYGRPGFFPPTIPYTVTKDLQLRERPLVGINEH